LAPGHRFPGVETPGYSQASLRDDEDEILASLTETVVLPLSCAADSSFQLLTKRSFGQEFTGAPF